MTSRTRQNMLQSQIRTGHVLDERLLGALMSVQREMFVPEALQGAAYIDDEIPLGAGRFLMEPLAFARLLDHAAIAPDETVLDIGAATGYSSAVLSMLAQKVVAVEENVALATRARTLLAPYSNIELAQAPLAAGFSQWAPYDVILIQGAIQLLPGALGDQLREGGRLLAVEHDADAKLSAAGLGKLVRYIKVNGILYKTLLRDANVTLLPQFKKPPVFAF